MLRPNPRSNFGHSFSSTSARHLSRLKEESELPGIGVSGLAQFASWSELERFLERNLGLESATISLQRDFVGSETPDTLGELSACEIDERSLLLELPVGYQTRLATHLVRSEDDGQPWPPKSFYRFIARCALDIYATTVSNHMVDLMATPRGDRIATLFLDKAGGVESGSAEAAAVRRLFEGEPRGCEDFFPAAVKRYVERMIERHSKAASSADLTGIVFALRARERFVHCLLRRVADEGYLLSLWQGEA